MVPDLGAFLALAQSCGPAVAPATLLSVVHVESRFDPLAIGVNGAAPRRLSPATPAEAVRIATTLIAAGRNIDLGLGQINSKNLGWLGLSVADAFDPCRNLAASAKVLQAGYAPTDPTIAAEQTALRAALSRYNTGHPTRGLRNGYVAKVTAAASQYVPAIAVSGPDAAPTPDASAQLTPRATTSPTWDVFGRAASRWDGGFVFTPASSQGDIQ